MPTDYPPLVPPFLVVDEDQPPLIYSSLIPENIPSNAEQPVLVIPPISVANPAEDAAERYLGGWFLSTGDGFDIVDEFGSQIFVVGFGVALEDVFIPGLGDTPTYPPLVVPVVTAAYNSAEQTYPPLVIPPLNPTEVSSGQAYPPLTYASLTPTTLPPNQDNSPLSIPEISGVPFGAV